MKWHLAKGGSMQEQGIIGSSSNKITFLQFYLIC